ncbi:MAG: protein TolR [Gammaproteobacteria bacterium]
MKKYRARRRPMADINVVPYIDVMLVLLVIFMITTPLLSQGVKVNLPQASAQPLSSKNQQPIIVTVDVKGNYYLNIANNPAQAIDASALQNQVTAELTTAQQQGQQRQVLVKGDQRADYGKVVQAMVLLQQAGASTVGLMTESPDNNFASTAALKSTSSTH